VWLVMLLHSIQQSHTSC